MKKKIFLAAILVASSIMTISSQAFAPAMNTLIRVRSSADMARANFPGELYNSRAARNTDVYWVKTDLIGWNNWVASQTKEIQNIVYYFETKMADIVWMQMKRDPVFRVAVNAKYRFAKDPTVRFDADVQSRLLARENMARMQYWVTRAGNEFIYGGFRYAFSGEGPSGKGVYYKYSNDSKDEKWEVNHGKWDGDYFPVVFLQQKIRTQTTPEAMLQSWEHAVAPVVMVGDYLQSRPLDPRTISLILNGHPHGKIQGTLASVPTSPTGDDIRSKIQVTPKK